MVSYQPVGFIGLGKMGAPMAINLSKKGYPLVIYDIMPAAMETVVRGAGGSPLTASSAAEVAQRCRRIITMLPSTQEVQSVFEGGSGLLSTVRVDSLLIDCSTTDPSATQHIGYLTSKKGASFVDAPAVGSVFDAQNKSLKFLVGGLKSDYFDAVELLSCLGHQLIHCGQIGMGQVCKICNNMLVGINMIGLSEVMNLGESLGVEAELLNKVINTGPAQCWASKYYNPVPGLVADTPASNNYEGGFSSENMAQDLQLAQEVGRMTKSLTPMGALAAQIYQMMELHGFGSMDYSSVYKYLSTPMKKASPVWSSRSDRKFSFF